MIIDLYIVLRATLLLLIKYTGVTQRFSETTHTLIISTKGRSPNQKKIPPFRSRKVVAIRIALSEGVFSEGMAEAMDPSILRAHVHPGLSGSGHHKRARFRDTSVVRIGR